MSENTKLNHFLRESLRRGGSDLLLAHGVAASIRINGEVEKIGDARLDRPEIESPVQPVLTPVGAAQYQGMGTSNARTMVEFCGASG